MHQWEAVDLFSGCGGMSAGLQAAGIDLLYSADTDEWANATYHGNLGHRPERVDLGRASQGHLRARWAESINERRQSGAKLLVTGGPPCQGFSSHVKTTGDKHGRNVLVPAFAKLAVSLEPDVILMENVADLMSTRSWEVFQRFRGTLRRAGYVVRARIINFAAFGIPQERFRTVVLATREIPPSYPAAIRQSPQDYATVKEAIGDLPRIAVGEANPSDPMHEPSRHRESTLDILRQVPHDGGSRPIGVGPACLDRTKSKHGGYTDVYGRLSWSDPAPTITARCRTPSCGRFAHPEQDRGLTVREAALLQTFPRDWQFAGPFDDRYKQVGNAVPPTVAEIFGRHIIEGLPVVANEAGVIEVDKSPVGSSFSVLIPGVRKRERLSNP